MTAYIIAIEGGDGVGKNTISHALAESLRTAGNSVEVIDFPRYGDTLAGVALSQFLNGKTKRPVTPKVASVLYALDRLEFKTEIDAAVERNDFVIFDRYVASNVAYQAAKVKDADRFTIMDWVANLELVVLGLRAPDLNVFLNLDVATARELVKRKAKRDYTGLIHDIHEADDQLQEKLRENYKYLASNNLISDWLQVEVSDRGILRSPSLICAEIKQYIHASGKTST
ncbi:MAG: dTMP kinase [Loktanella sp.]|nr:dTMP kinase [Loktanella sp.]